MAKVKLKRVTVLVAVKTEVIPQGAGGEIFGNFAVN